MAGKIRFHILISWTINIYLCFGLIDSLNTNAYSRRAYLRGGLIFEKLHEQPILVNPTQVTFYRHMNVTLLLQTNKLLQHYTDSYQQFCNNIRGIKTPDTPDNNKEFFVLADKQTIAMSAHACSQHQGKLPEVRSSKEKTLLRQVAFEKGVTIFPAGIQYDELDKLFVFSTMGDAVQFSPKIFKSLIYYNDSKPIELSPQSELAHTAAVTHSYTYDFSNKDGQIVMLGSNTIQARYDVICERIVHDDATFSDTLLMKMTAHTCARDAKQLNATTHLLTNELNDFFQDNKRQQRQVSNKKPPSLACHSKPCSILQDALNNIDNNLDQLEDLHVPIAQLKLYAIFQIGITHNLFNISTFNDFLALIQNSNEIITTLSDNPEAELFYFKAMEIKKKHFSNKANKNIFPKDFFTYESYILLELKAWLTTQVKPSFMTIKRSKRFALGIGGGLMLSLIHI
mgnify:CR=1 FL=1